MMTGHWLTRTIHVSFLACLSLILVACGGGGGGGDAGSGGFLGGGGDATYTLSIETFDPQGTSTREFSASQPLQVVVTLSGDSVSGQRVELSSTVGTVEPDNGSALTDANGRAEFVVNAPAETGAGTLTARFAASSGEVTQTLGVEVVAEDNNFVLDLQTLNAAGASSRQFSTDTVLDIVATLYRSEAGQLTPVSDVVLTAESSIGTLSPDNGSALSDAAGLARFSLTGGEVTGAGTVTVSYVNNEGATLVARSVNVEAVDVGSGYQLALTTTQLDGAETRAFSSDAPLLVRAQVTSTIAGVSVEGLLVTLASTVGAVTPEGGASLTDAQGIATFLLEADGVVGAGTITATVTVAGGTLATTSTVEAVSLSDTTRLRIEGFDPAGQPAFTFGEGAPLTLQVAVTDEAGVVLPIDGETIRLSSSIGSLSPSNGSALTNNGVATFTLSYDQVVGAGTVQATYTGADGSLVTSLNVEAIAAENFLLTLSVTGGNTEGQLGPDAPLQVTATLREAGVNGQLVAGELLSLDTAMGTVVPANGAQVTDAAGEAVFTLNYADVEGAGPVTVSYTSAAGDVFSNTVNIESARSAAPPRVQIEFTEIPDGTPSTQFSADAPLQIGVLVTEADGVTPRVGESVQLTNTIGQLSPANGIAITDASGIARFTLAFDGTTGAGVISASLTAFAASGVSQLSVQSIAVDTAYELSLLSASNNGVITPDVPVTLEFQLSSVDNTLSVANQVISLSSTLGTVSPGNGSTRTDANGIATFTVGYDAVIGAGTATASYSTASGTISAVTNLESISPLVGTRLELSTTTALGAQTRQLSAGEPLTVRATLVDETGATVLVTGDLVSLSSTLGTIAPATGTALLLDGVATFEVAFDGTVGAGELTATYAADGAVLEATQGIEAVVANPYSVTLSASAGDLTVVNPLTLTVTVLDAAGLPVTPAPIVDMSTTTGTLDRVSGVVDAAGQATFTLSYLEAVAGTVTASVTTAEGTFSNRLNVNAVEEAPNYAIEVLSITEADGVTATTSFSSSESAIVTVRLSEAGLPPAQIRSVSLALQGVAGEVLPANGVALTDEVTGEATFTVRYGGQTGAGQLITTYAGPLGDVSDSALISAVVADLDIGSLDDAGTYNDSVIRALPSTSVSYLGSVELLLSIVDAAGNPVDSAETVRFASPCLLNGFSTLNTDLTATVSGGTLSVTYTAGENCADRADTVDVTLVQAGRDVQERATVTLAIGAAPAANERFITFVSAEPVNMALRGTGGGTTLEERSQVTFEVRDGAGNPVAGQRVDFALSNTTGGIELADNSVTTDADGQVRATVFAGVIATPVRVIATTERRPAADANTDPADDPDAVSVISDQLSISSGIVTQARFSIAASVLNIPSAAVVNGVQTEISASAFDRFGNPVPDGTTVNFTSECGGIGGAGPTGACQTAAGFCTVTWFSQPGAADVCPDNRVTIMAHARGEEAFTDADANGFYSTDLDAPALANEVFTDNPEAWRDDDESGAYNSPELFIDIDSGAGDTPPLNGVHDSRTPPAPEVAALFNGLACLDETETFCKKALISVFDTVELVAGVADAGALTAEVFDGGGILLTPGIDPLTAGGYVLQLSDRTGGVVNIPPLGTELAATGSGECTVVSPNLTVGNSSAESPFSFPITIRTETDDPATDDFVEITWSIAGGNTAQVVFDCNP